MTVNRKDRELDIVLISAKDGSIVRNLTSGFDKDHGLRAHRRSPAGAGSRMPWMAWSPKGDRLAYFVRTEKERTLIIQNVLTQEDRGAHPDEDGRRAGVAGVLARRPDDRVLGAARRHRRHLHGRSRRRTKITNLTNDDVRRLRADLLAGRQVPDLQRARQREPEAVPLDLDTKKKTQLTFGTHDETAAQFLDDHTLVFSSTATDPAVPIDPEVAKNGNIFNIWTLDLRNGELKQYTDALGGNSRRSC